MRSRSTARAARSWRGRQQIAARDGASASNAGCGRGTGGTAFVEHSPAIRHALKQAETFHDEVAVPQGRGKDPPQGYPATRRVAICAGAAPGDNAWPREGQQPEQEISRIP